MDAHKPRTVTINDLREWNNRGELLLAPEYQRREVWDPKARSYLVDTIIKGFPIPAIFLRQRVDLKNKKTFREVVDGQQRVKAILAFLRDEFVIMKNHNEDLGGKKFSELPDTFQEKLLEYDVMADFLIGATTQDVLEMFARINSYAITLNPQEKINAKYFGKFKQTIFALGREHYEFWRRNEILSDKAISRMKDAELVADLVVAMLEGIQAKSVTKNYYEKYDDHFEVGKTIVANFENCIDYIAAFIAKIPKDSAFRSSTLFYNLFCAIYEFVFGLGKKGSWKIRRGLELQKSILETVSILDEVMNAPTEGVQKRYLGFKQSLKGQTTNRAQRILRHHVILKELELHLG